ncbi:MAG TPA: helix-turn-helix domain-containing protein [Anaerolineales bacterium]|nr:helix-turn-helix domain-containing protein [Anaerolineales bacterium]
MQNDQKAPRGNFKGQRRANPVSGCPLTAALTAIGGKWKLIIIYWLAESPKHFAALRRAIPGLSQKVLTQQLKELVQDGLVARTPTGDLPAPIEYALTEYGQSVLPLVEGVRQWGGEHLKRHSASANEGYLIGGLDSRSDIS